MKDIVVCLFAAAGLDKAAQGLIGAAQRLAGESGGQVTAILLGSGPESLASEVAAFVETVLVADQGELAQYQPEVCLEVLSQACRELSPRAVLFSSETYNQEIVPRLAHRLGGSAVGDAIALGLDGGSLRATRQVYGGKAQAVVEMKRSPGVAWLRARSFAPAATGPTQGEIKALQIIPGESANSRIVERRTEGAGQVRLEDARVIVAGGRGIGGSELFQQELAPLAQVLGGQIAATRAACDAGWVPALLQVGTTGKKVAPDLYLAIAVSGASQHTAGISDAKNIVAINTDPEASIFKYCRFGMVGDFRKVVPLLRERLTTLCQ